MLLFSTIYHEKKITLPVHSVTSRMIKQPRPRQAINVFISLYTFLIAVSLLASCQNKRPAKGMSEKNTTPATTDSGRLLSVASLEQADSGRKIIAWFFETPQVFELDLAPAQAQHFYHLLKEAKENKRPVNIYYTPSPGKNSIDRVTPATPAQLQLFEKTKAEQQKADTVPRPPDS
jgi:hypothetical protein